MTPYLMLLMALLARMMTPVRKAVRVKVMKQRYRRK
jgi:hypothetical protein